MSKNCIFCKILDGSIPGSFIYKDELCTAFLDIQPVNEGHVLIIPNVHAESITELDDETTGRMLIVANKINLAIRKTNLKCEGINYFLADGEAAFQEVFHTHLHCFPRYKGDGFGLKFGDNYENLPDREQLNQIADEIKRELKGNRC